MSSETDISGTRTRREAASSAPQHEGPTAERYESALHRYVTAVAADEAADKPQATEGTIVFSAAFAAWTVADVMSRGVLSAHEDALFKEIADVLHQHRISALPVTDGERRVLGVVTVSDLLARMSGAGEAAARGHHAPGRAAAHRKRHAVTARELMTSPAITVTPAATVETAARLAARSRVRSLPVVDTDGKLVGIVTRSDLIKVFLRDDEEIRHDIERDVIGDSWHTDAGHVYVEVSEGVVTLCGRVPTARAARRLVHAAHLVVGAVDVQAELVCETGDRFMALGR